MLNKVFVYGTLKPGLRYHCVAQMGGSFEANEAYVEGFSLYHLSPENYPAITKEGGVENRVYGWCYTYEDINLALHHLDDLEGVDSNPPLYTRIQTKAFYHSNCQKSAIDPVDAWVYVYHNSERCSQDASSAFRLRDGIWLPLENANISMEKV